MPVSLASLRSRWLSGGAGALGAGSTGAPTTPVAGAEPRAKPRRSQRMTCPGPATGDCASPERCELLGCVKIFDPGPWQPQPAPTELATDAPKLGLFERAVVAATDRINALALPKAPTPAPAEPVALEIPMNTPETAAAPAMAYTPAPTYEAPQPSIPAAAPPPPPAPPAAPPRPAVQDIRIITVPGGYIVLATGPNGESIPLGVASDAQGLAERVHAWAVSRQ